MVAKTGKIHISGTATVGVEIPTTSPRCLTMTRSVKVSESDCDNYGSGNEKIRAKTARFPFPVVVVVAGPWTHFHRAGY